MSDEKKVEERANEFAQVVINKGELTQLNIYLNNEIESPNYYVEVLNMLRTASPKDSVTMYINSPGGHLDTTIQLLNAMDECEAQVTTVLDGIAHSAASLLFLNGDNLMIYKYASMMCHMYSSLTFGKAHELKAQVDFSQHLYRDMMSELYGGFLTEDEIKEMFEGKDFWFNSKDIAKRIVKLRQFRTNLANAIEKKKKREKKSQEASK